MSAPADTPEARRRTCRNVAVLVIAQGTLGAQMSMLFITAGLAGRMLSPWACLATLPISVVMLASALTARPLSAFMARRGRRAGFTVASLLSALGAAVAFEGLRLGSFLLFTCGTMLVGCYMSAQGFYRFAAADSAPEAIRPRAISLVQAGGLAAALSGPVMVRLTAEAGPVPFAMTFAAIAGLNLLGPLVFALLDSPLPKAPEHAATGGRTTGQMIRTPRIAVAIVCGMVSYALMNLVMTSTPLAMVGCGFQTADAANVVSTHVLAMYLPSFVTGSLIARFGAAPIVAIGLAILACAGGVAMAGVSLTHFFGALVLLGVGWNFGFIGATTMLAAAHSAEERGRLQGINDAVVFGGVFLASLSSGGLMGCLASSPQAGWTAVNMAMIPLLMLAGGALIWLTLRPRESEAG